MFDIFSNLNSEIKKMEKSDFISLYRNSLMGIAILWIVFYHSGINFGKIGFLSYFCSFIKYTGYLGVDIFFFVSGFGLMASWYKKRPSILFFYKRRFLRIMPIYWFFLSIYLVLITLFGTPITNLGTVFIYYTGFSFFISRTNNIHWFISAILLCYLIFPFFENYFQKNKNKLRFLIFIVTLCLTLAIILTASAFIFANKFSFLLIVILRLPAFFIGSLIGYIYIKRDNNFNYLFSIYLHVFFTFFCFVALALIYYFCSTDDRWLYGLYWYPFMLGSFSLTFLLSILLDILHTHHNYLLDFLDKIGRSSLELYFIHLLVFAFIGSKLIFNYFGILPGSNYLWIAAIFVSVILSNIFNSILSHLNILFK